MEIEKKIEWCIEKHRETNHFYDKYLPYEFHLRMVATVCDNFIHLIPNSDDGNTPKRQDVKMAAFGHDLIEDCRVSYNDVKEVLGHSPAEIIYSVSNEKGKNRKERANEKYYEGIRNTEGAVFVKMCDRIANVQYSIITGSRMFSMYKKENDNFVKSLGFSEEYKHPLYDMYLYLKNLFEKGETI